MAPGMSKTGKMANSTVNVNESIQTALGMLITGKTVNLMAKQVKADGSWLVQIFNNGVLINIETSEDWVDEDCERRWFPLSKCIVFLCPDSFPESCPYSAEHLFTQEKPTC